MVNNNDLKGIAEELTDTEMSSGQKHRGKRPTRRVDYMFDPYENRLG